MALPANAEVVVDSLISCCTIKRENYARVFFFEAINWSFIDDALCFAIARFEDKVYLLVFVFALIFAKASDVFEHKRLSTGGENSTQLRPKYLWGFYCLSFFFLFALAAFRINIGTDYSLSIPHIDYYMGNIGLDMFYGDLNAWDIGCVLSIKMISLFTADLRWVFAVWSFASLALVYRAIFKYSSNPALSLMVFLLLGYYFMSYNMSRQFISMAIILNSVPYLFSYNKKNFLKYSLLVFLAATFHQSALLMLPVYFISKLNYSSTGKFPLILVALVAGLYCLKTVIYTFLPLTPYGVYLSSDFYSAVDLNLTLTLIFLGIFCMSLMVTKKKKLTCELRVFLSILILTLAVLLSGVFLPKIFFRVVYYFSIFSIFLIPELFSCIANSHEKTLWQLICLVIGIVFCCLTCFDNGCFPYQSFLL